MEMGNGIMSTFYCLSLANPKKKKKEVINVVLLL